MRDRGDEHEPRPPLFRCPVCGEHDPGVANVMVGCMACAERDVALALAPRDTTGDVDPLDVQRLEWFKAFGTFTDFVVRAWLTYDADGRLVDFVVPELPPLYDLGESGA